MLIRIELVSDRELQQRTRVGVGTATPAVIVVVAGAGGGWWLNCINFGILQRTSDDLLRGGIAAVAVYRVGHYYYFY